MPKVLRKGNNSIDLQIDNRDNSTGRVDIAQALKLRYKNKLTLEEIGIHFGVSKQAISQALRKYMPILNRDVSAYNDVKSEVLSALELEMLSYMLDRTKLKDASLNNVAYAFTQVNNANRLEQGKSTGNLSIHGDIQAIKDLQGQTGNDNQPLISLAAEVNEAVTGQDTGITQDIVCDDADVCHKPIVDL